MIYQLMLAEIVSEDEYIQMPVNGKLLLPPITAPYYKETTSHKFDTWEEAFIHLCKLQTTKNVVERREYYVYSRPL
jgi:hypothetical protein